MKGKKTLYELREGEEGIISALECQDRVRLNKLLSLGVSPGQRISLIQRHPAYIFSIGFTRLAVDREIAKMVIVSDITDGRKRQAC